MMNVTNTIFSYRYGPYIIDFLILVKFVKLSLISFLNDNILRNWNWNDSIFLDSKIIVKELIDRKIKY